MKQQPEEKSNPGIIDLPARGTRPAAKQKESAPVAAPIPVERALIIVSDQAPKEKKS